MTKVFSILYIVVIFAAFGIVACNEDKHNYEKNEKNDIIRFDKLLFETDTSQLISKLEDFHQKHPRFYTIYFSKIVPIIGFDKDKKTFEEELKKYVTDKSLREIYQLTKEEFGDLNDINKQFEKAFDRYRRLFDNDDTPLLFAYISGFNTQRFIFEENDRDCLAFGLDLFLGDKYPYTTLNNNRNTFASYLTRTYNKDHLVKKVLELWLDDKMKISDNKRAIDYIIKNGKKLYILKQLMPEINDTVLLEYDEEQLKWLNNNEKEMWSYYIEKNFFYTTDRYVIKRLVEAAPNSQALGMPRKSPGYTGNYLGYKIVSAYMKRNKELSLNDLIKDKDSQKILELSKFKPKIK